MALYTNIVNNKKKQHRSVFQIKKMNIIFLMFGLDEIMNEHRKYKSELVILIN